MVCMAIVVDRKEEEAEFGVSFELLTTAWVFQFIFSIIITFFLTKTEDVAIESG